MSTEFATFAQNMIDADSSAHRTKAFSKFLQSCGFDAFAQLSCPQAKFEIDPVKLVTTYPAKWVEHYFKEGFAAHDPVLSHATKAHLPFVWSQALGRTQLNRQQLRLMREATDIGLDDGFCLPISIGGERHSLISVSFSNRNSGYASSKLNELIAGAYHFLMHQQQNVAHLTDTRDEDKPPCLTSREYECIALAAHGKSAWEIGKILSITERTAVFHLENVRRKLGAQSRSHAIVMLIKAGRLLP